MKKEVRKDEKSIMFGKEVLDNLFPNLPKCITAETDDYGFDIIQGDNVWEVKTNRRKFKEWYQVFGSYKVTTRLAPPTGLSVEDLQSWVDNVEPDRLDTIAAKYTKEDKTHLRYFPLNVTTNKMKVDGSKWWKIVNHTNSNLMVIFGDGVLLFSHKQLMDAAAFYGWMKTQATKEFWNKKETWQLKIFLDVRKGKFYSMEVPEGVFYKS